MRPHFLNAALAGMLLCSQAAAGEQHPNLDGKAILAQQQGIRAEANSGKGRYKDMPAATRQELFSKQDEVASLIGDVAWTTELAETDQVALVNALESIEAILNNAEDQRLVCERVRRTGSHLTQTFCMTVAERRAENEVAQSVLRTRDQQCLKDASGMCR